MENHLYLAFVIATTIMILSPGPSVLLTVAHSISYGWQVALLTVAGATAGIAVQLAVASIGLASVLNTVAGAFIWLGWAGAAYLVYLGIRTWQGANTPLALDARPASRANLFVQGLVITVPNPKSLIFIAAFLPQFVDSTRPLGLQFAIIIPTFLVITFGVTSLWALVAGTARGLLQSQRGYRTVLRGAGSLMVIAGLALVFVRLT